MSDKKPQETVGMTQLAPNRLATAEYAHQTFVATPETGTPPDALLDPKYWAHYSVNPNVKINVGDIVLVKPEDGTYFMELMARDAFRGGIKMVELRRVVLDAEESPADADFGKEFEIKHSGPNLKWRVIRKVDKRELVNGISTKEAARDWVREHKKSLAA
jgi:hypothetical protein